MMIDQINQWITGDGIRQKYSLEAYLSYCQNVRRCLWRNGDLEQPLIEFFEKQFVEEMEPLSLICNKYFSEGEKGVTVQYEPNGDKTFPDGKITSDHVKEILVECVSAKSQEELIEALRKNNSESSQDSIPISGLPDFPKANWGQWIITGSEWSHYTKSVVAQRVLEKCDKIKLKSLTEASVWLCVTIDAPLVSEEPAGRFLDWLDCFLKEFVTEYQQALQEASIKMLWGVAKRYTGEDWVKNYPVN